MHGKFALWCLGTVIAAVAAPAGGADWPAFRGPEGNGVAAADAAPPLTWSREQNVGWRLPLAAPGNGSPIVIGETVYVTVADKPGKTLSLLAVDRKTGHERWQQSVSDDHPAPTHNTNPYASPTPTADAERVIVWYGDAGLHAYAHDGKTLWTVETPGLTHIWGYGSSPVLRDGRVYLNTGIGPEPFIAAYDAATGKELWKTPEPENTGGVEKPGGWIGSWGTPVFVSVDGQLQLLCAQPTRVVAYHPDTGEILWYCAGLKNLPRGNLVYSSLMVGDGVAAALGGYNGPGMGFRLGGTGDVTESNRLWRHGMSNPQRIGSGVVIGEHLFMPNAGPGVLQCLNLATGEELWRARPQAGGNYWGSVVLAANRLYVTNQEGTTVVFAPNAEKFEQLAENRLGEHCNATPAVVGRELFIRTYGALYCLREQAE